MFLNLFRKNFYMVYTNEMIELELEFVANYEENANPRIAARILVLIP